MTRSHLWCVGVCASFAVTLNVAAQPTRAVAPPSVEFREPFTRISSVRELRDGRIIVADSRENTLQLIDLARGVARPIGRQGAGPAEWSMPSTLFALPGDTTWMIDPSTDRYFVILPDGTPGRTIPFNQFPAFLTDGLTGVDRSGRMLTINERRNANPEAGTSGVVDVMRYDRRTKRVDTVANLAWPKDEMSVARSLPNGMLQMSTNLPFAAHDIALLANDGRIAVVRAAPYRVEWIATSGVVTRGPVASAPRIKITDAERQAFIRSQIRPGRIITSAPVGAPPPSTTAAAPRARAQTLSNSELDALMNPDMKWPAEKPPFLHQNGAHIAPDGRVWVQRTRAHNDSIPVYDIFDAGGRVVERRSLPKRTRLVAFGAKSIYLARTDDDDLLWLQRIPYPQ